MTRYIKRIILSIAAALLLNTAYAQSTLYDCENSHKFANYLYNTKQYSLAIHELERINYFCDTDSATRLIMIKTYRKLKEYDKANQFYTSANFDQLKKMNPEYRLEYMRLLMLQNKYAEVQKSIEKGLDFRQKNEYSLGIELLQQNYSEAYALSKQYSEQQSFVMHGLTTIAQKSYQTTRKKPWLSMLMSAVIPGSGKMYCGYWGDGLVSLLFSASSAFFSYRAFNKYGTEKVYPWIAGGLAVSYYTGNVYGGYKAAKRYNNNLNNEFTKQTEHILFSDY